MSAAHTPGPWAISTADGSGDSLYVGGMVLQSPYTAFAYRASTPSVLLKIDRETLYANARMISAVPDLLKAANEALEYLESWKDLSCGKAYRMLDTAIAKATVDTQYIKRTPGTVPMHSHDTTVGEGDMPVTCRFDIDSDGDIETMQVWYGDMNIFRALTLAQIVELEAECYVAAEEDFKESKADAAIARFESDCDEVTL